MMHITFHNSFHYGDIHYSRSFVRHTVSEILKHIPNATFGYLHHNREDVISDIPEVKELPNGINLPKHHETFVESSADSIFINTWIGSRQHRFMAEGGCGACFSANRLMWQEIWATLNDTNGWNISPPDNWEECIPKIDYTKYHITGVDEHFKTHQARKRVFVSNGAVLSGQAINFNFDQIITEFADKNPDCAFYMTNHYSINKPNVFSTSNIIQKPAGCDLNENSYLSKFCDVIVGRASGPFAFASCYENFMDNNKTLCVFSNNQGEGNWYSDGSCLYKWCLSNNAPLIKNIIETSLK